jgi:microcystin-dependent protein
MSEPFIGEIRIFGFSFPPRGWAQCAGQLMAISQNTALFSILGTTYGGNGTSTFGLPDMRGRIPVSSGQGPGLSPYVLGEMTGTETVTLTASQLPAHNHAAGCSSSAGNSLSGAGAVPAADMAGGNNVFSSPANATMNAASLSLVGGGQPHNNLQAYLAVNYCIALNGIFPSRN